MSVATPDLSALASQLSGDLNTGRTMRTLYSTDASEYQKMPLAVALPCTGPLPMPPVRASVAGETAE